MSGKRKDIVYLNKETAELARDPGAFFARNSGFLFLFCVIVPWPVAVILGFFRDIMPAPVYFVISSATTYAVMLATCIAFIAGYRQRIQSGITGASPKAFTLAVFIQCSAYPALLFISEACAYLMPSRAPAFNKETMDALLAIGPVGGYIILALVPAATEELVCRGVIYGALRRRGMADAFMFSVLCFSLMHRNVTQMIYTALLGILLCFIREYSGSVFPCMLSHLAFNTVGFCNIYFPFEASQDAVSGDAGFMTRHKWLLAAAVAGIAVMAVLIGFLRKSRPARQDVELSGDAGSRMPILPYAVGWALCLAAAILL